MPSEETRLLERNQSQALLRLIRIFVAGMLCLHALIFVLLRERISRGFPDFTVFYTGGMILRQGLGPQLYDEHIQQRVQQQFTGTIESRRGPLPYIHPPFEALIFAPLTLLPYRDAFLVWDLLNLVGLFVIALILRRHLDFLRSPPLWQIVLSFLAFFPVFLCLLQGQDSVLILLLCSSAYSALKREKDALAGCWLAIATVKLQIALPLVLLLLWWRRKRLAVGFVGVAVVLGAISLLLVGWQGLLRYPGYVLHIARSTELGGVPPALMPNLRGLIEGWPWQLPPSLLTGLVALASIALVIFFAREGNRASRARFDLQFSMAMVATALVSWHTNAHDLSVLILPLALLVNYCWSKWKDSARPELALLIPTLPLLISPLWIALWLGIGKLNLMALAILWWGWEIARAAAGSTHPEPELVSGS